MKRSLRGPEPPFVGAVYQARTRSMRRWEVQEQHVGGEWTLRPMGHDVEVAKKTLRFDGIPSPLRRLTEELRDRKKWRMVGVTERATR